MMADVLGSWHDRDVVVLSPTPSHPQDHGNRKQWVTKGEIPEPRHRTQAAFSVHVWGAINEDPALCKLVVHDEVDPNAPKFKRGRPKKTDPPRDKAAKKRNVTSDVYIDDCLKLVFEHMSPANKKKLMFMQDGARVHTSKKSMEYLKKHNVQVLEDWPARSPDLNPIEKVWSILSGRVSARGPMTKASLQQFVVEEWNKLIADGTTVRMFVIVRFTIARRICIDLTLNPVTPVMLRGSGHHGGDCHYPPERGPK